MRLLLFADVRSPIARSWHRTACEANIDVVFVDSSALAVVEPADKGPSSVVPSRRFSSANWLGELAWRASGIAMYPRARSRLKTIISSLDADVVHALRIPFEGIYAEGLGDRAAKVISVWGNDFTLHTARSKWLCDSTLRVLKDCDGLHTDCARDLRLARSLGFSAHRPSLVAPGSGGIDRSVFRPWAEVHPDRWGLPRDSTVIVNARGNRSYVCNKEFFAAVPHILARHPNVHFVCPGMAGVKSLERIVATKHLQERCHLLPAVRQLELAQLMSIATISVSITKHDGTPNSLLESMACGAVPLVSPVESVLEWVTDSQTGFITKSTQPADIADAILRSLDSPDLRLIRERNLQTISARVDRATVVPRVERFYEAVLSGSGK